MSIHNLFQKIKLIGSSKYDSLTNNIIMSLIHKLKFACFLQALNGFAGVGGHLFAIATDLSMKAGFDGFVVAEAMDQACSIITFLSLVRYRYHRLTIRIDL